MSTYLSYGFVAPLLTPVSSAEGEILNGHFYRKNLCIRINQEGTLVYCDCSQPDLHPSDSLVVSSPRHLRLFAKELAGENLVITSQVSYYVNHWVETKRIAHLTLIDFLNNLKEI